ncbi:helicase [Proteus phage 10]|nr:helicase [Proteus phage 10]
MRSTATITIRSHGFSVTDYNGEFYRHLTDYCRKFVKTKMMSSVAGGRRVMKQVPDRVFASATNNRRELRFHINVLKEFYSFMQQRGYNTSRFKTIKDMPEQGHDKSMEFKSPDVQPRPHQVDYIAYQLDRNKEGVTTKINTLQTGKGKLQPLSSKIKIPGGWTTMGEIKVGDFVISRDGTATEVDGVYPNGVKKMYKVTFADGRSTRCGAEHLWHCYFETTSPDKRWRTVTTQELIDYRSSVKVPRVCVPLIEPEVTPKADLPIDPYILGALIGDGSFVSGSLMLTTPDEEILEEFHKELPVTLSIKYAGKYDWRISKKPKLSGENEWVGILRRLGMWGHIHYEKEIPEIYMNGSIEQRLHLLQGLLDTDGTVQKSGSVSFNTSSPKLAEQVQYLIRSLGGIAAINTRIPTYTYKGEKLKGRRTYDVDIRFKKPSSLFRLSRKKNRTNDNNQYAANLKLRIINIEEDGEEDSQCISVKHPEHLYVTDDFIVTHNTFCAIYNMVKLEKLTVIVLMPRFILTWLTGLDDFVKLNPGDVMVVQGSAELNGCMKLAEENKLDAKIVIVSLPTFQYFMSEYEDTNGKMKGYTHTPDEFWKLLNPGFLIVDEGHESIHALFKLDLYTNVMNKLVLSATLEADDEFINDIYYMIYPNSMRFKNGEYDKYIESIALMYGLQNPNLVKFKGFGGAYSHVKFEQSIIKNKKLLWSWLEFNRTIFEHLFIRKKEDGMRCLIYCATVEMCLLVASHLTEAYPELDIRKFTQEDPKETLYEADCSVSTLKSAGTGVDIPELFCVICTVAIGSKQQSNQSLGRLRRLKSFPDAVPRYCYLTCTGIKQHMDYHRRKVITFDNKTLSQKEVNSGFSL